MNAKQEPTRLRIENGQYQIYSTARKMFVETSKEAFEALKKYPDVIVEGERPAGKLRYVIYENAEGRKICRGNEAHFTPDKREFDVTDKEGFEIEDIIKNRTKGQEYEIDRLSLHDPKAMEVIDYEYPLNKE